MKSLATNKPFNSGNSEIYIFSGKIVSSQIIKPKSSEESLKTMLKIQSINLQESHPKIFPNIEKYIKKLYNFIKILERYKIKANTRKALFQVNIFNQSIKATIFTLKYCVHTLKEEIFMNKYIFITNFPMIKTNFIYL